jgi:hypothetical protein
MTVVVIPFMFQYQTAVNALDAGGPVDRELLASDTTAEQARLFCFDAAAAFFLTAVSKTDIALICS